MRALVAGERAPLDATRLSLACEGAPPALALIALDDRRRALADFAPIDSVTRELRPGAGFHDGRLDLDLAELPRGVERLVLLAFRAEGGALVGTHRRITVATDMLTYTLDLTDRADAAVILVEIYRHGGGWRLSANGQGFVHGLSAVADGFGIDPGWARRFARDPAPYDDDRPRGGGNANGSGVAVGPHHVLTNAHVVDGAGGVAVTGDGGTVPAECVFADSRNDLALLRVERMLPAVARFRTSLDLHLGEDVVVLGFPLQGLLGTGPQASAGNVAALTGIGNDSTQFQFTAPIASGNSGGPIVDLSGHVVGLVCASLNLDSIRRAGASAENVNFGIKSAVIRSFLDAFGMMPQLAPDETPLGRAAVVRQARETIYRIACR